MAVYSNTVLMLM